MQSTSPRGSSSCARRTIPPGTQWRSPICAGSPSAGSRSSSTRRTRTSIRHAIQCTSPTSTTTSSSRGRSRRRTASPGSASVTPSAAPRLLDYVDRLARARELGQLARPPRRPRGTRGRGRTTGTRSSGSRASASGCSRSSAVCGLRAFPSGGNFLAVDCSAHPGGASGLAAAVLANGVVVRPLGSLVRISIGRREESDALVAALARVIEAAGAS